MNRILIVDDETDLELLIRQKFRKKIREQQYDFLFAINGRDALEKIDSNPDVELVLSDINMPEMDGLTLLTKLHDSNPLIKTIIVSAYGDMDNIRKAMNNGAFDFVTKPVNFDDLSLTIEKTLKHVSMIKETLQAVKENNILKMYVDENVLSFMGSKETETQLFENETVEVSVAFIDICGFTAISETQPANYVVNLLNEYFDIMVKEIIQQGGTVDKFIGDAVMAVFKGEYHLDRAVEACLAIKAALEKQPAEEKKSKYKPRVSIGIDSGEVVSGNIGSSTLRRLDYTVIGDHVNVAARFQAAAKPNQILISEENYLKINQSFVCNKVGEMSLKNKEHPIMVYEVIS